jgi:hypothetical protein
MRNDARPIGHENSRQSPVVSHESEVVSHQSGGDRRQPQSTADDRLPDLLDLDGDPVMPANDSTLKTRI